MTDQQQHIFVTGANGLLGRAVLDKLLDTNHRVTALVRAAGALDSYPRRAQVKTVVGDVCNVPGFAEDLSGCSVVFHLAARHREYLETRSGEDILFKTNVDGTMNLIKAAENAGVQRFVYVSSAGVIKRSRRPACEDDTYDLKTKNAYFLSKIKAEQAIDRYLCTLPKMAVVVARPSMMLGPQDQAPTVAGQFVRNFILQENAVVLPGFAVVIDSRDVAEGLYQMIGKGRSGDRFILAGKRFSFADLNDRLQKLSGVPMPKPRPSYIVAYLVMAIRGLLGLEVPLKASEIRYMQRLIAPDPAKMNEVLGVRCRPIDDTLSDTIRWFRS